MSQLYGADSPNIHGHQTEWRPSASEVDSKINFDSPDQNPQKLANQVYSCIYTVRDGIQLQRDGKLSDDDFAYRLKRNSECIGMPEDILMDLAQQWLDEEETKA